MLTSHTLNCDVLLWYQVCNSINDTEQDTKPPGANNGCALMFTVLQILTPLCVCPAPLLEHGQQNWKVFPAQPQQWLKASHAPPSPPLPTACSHRAVAHFSLQKNEQRSRAEAVIPGRWLPDMAPNSWKLQRLCPSLPNTNLCWFPSHHENFKPPLA